MHKNPRDPQLTLKTLLDLTDIPLEEVLFIRHSQGAASLSSLTESTGEAILRYTREQAVHARKFPQTPPTYWFVFLAETGGKCRLYAVYENNGEVLAERTADHRYFDLRVSQLFATYQGRLLIEWTKDYINWAKPGRYAQNLAVAEIAPREVKDFPGYDNIVLSYAELQQVVSEDSLYVKWRAALEAVQGIYLITDTVTGKHYVGKADGSERILGRWRTYAADGHGGNVALREMQFADADYAQRYQFSLLRVFGPQTPQLEVDRAETHFKRALLSRQFGLNRN